MKKKVLVTGATGFLGNYLIPYLLEKGIEVVASSRNETHAKSFNWFDKVHFKSFDLNEQNDDLDLFSYFENPDKIIHLSWENLPNYNEPFHLEKNLPNQYRFLKNLIDHGAKDLTVIGTCLEYGMQNGCLSESTTTIPSNPYAIAKDSLQKKMTALQTNLPFKLKWVRLFYLYGDGQSTSSLYTQMTKAISNQDKSFNMSFGEQLRDFLPIQLAIEYISKISLSEENIGIVNCCSGEPQSVKKFVSDFFASRHYPIHLNLGYYPYPTYEPMEFWGATDKLKSIVGNG